MKPNRKDGVNKPELSATEKSVLERASGIMEELAFYYRKTDRGSEWSSVTTLIDEELGFDKVV